MMSPSRTAAIGPPARGFRRHVAGHQPVRRPEKRPSVTSATESPRPAPTIAAVTPSISRMPGPPFGPSWRMTTTSPCLDAAGLDGFERGFLAVEHARRSAMHAEVVARDLHHAAVGREVAAKDHETARRLERRGDRAHDLLSGRFDGGRRLPRQSSGRSRSSRRRAARPASADASRRGGCRRRGADRRRRSGRRASGRRAAARAR